MVFEKMKEPIFITTTFKLCDNNGYLSTQIRNFFGFNGHALVDHPGQAETIVISTCGFDQEREDVSMSVIDSHMQNYAGKKRIIICGCLTKINPDRLDLSRVDLIGPKELHRFNEIFAPAIPIEEVSGSRLDQRFIDPQYGFFDAFNLQICQGCVNNCSYCGIKKAKGEVTSKPVDRIVGEVEQALEQGYRQFMLLGDDCASYGKDLNTDLSVLLNKLRHYDIRININYLEPRGFFELYPRINADVFQKINFMSIPVQSASGRVLGLMNRRYEIDAITDMVVKIKEKSPDTFIETHVLYGFPSETREEFEKSFGLTLYFDSVIYFYYTERKNVTASTLPGKMNADEMVHRTRRIMGHPSFTRDPDSDKVPQVLLGYGLSEAELLQSIRKSYPEE
jgi:MiaB/RimO family radical SAM methylthiotransferase